MTGFDDQLQGAFDELALTAPHRQDLAESVRRRSRYRQGIIVAPAMAAVVVLAVIGAFYLFRPASAQRVASSPAATICRFA